MRAYRPLRELLAVRLREFWREPEIIFWVYGFPLLLTIGLGIAFRNGPVEQVFVDVEEAPGAEAVASALSRSPELVVGRHAPEICRERLRLGKSSLVVVPGESIVYRYDPTRPESAFARRLVDDVLQRASGRADPIAVSEQLVTEPGARYIDFLVPGLLGMNLLGSGLWGVGFIIVDMRVKKLLKRMVATPMRRAHYLWSMIFGRLIFMVPEVIVILGAGVLLFGISVRGSWLSIALVSFVGALSFSGLGLLAASRARRLETVSGIMNLIMLPMWLMSGIFFSADRFPAFAQPFVQALPLTQLNYALRAVILEGAPLGSQAVQLLVLVLYGGVSFAVALRWFRWS